MIPKAIVFDLGKVLVDFDYTIAARKFVARGQLSFERVVQFLLESSVLYDYETGRLTSEQFYRAVCEATGFCGDVEEFGNCFGDIFSPIEPMIEIHAALRKRGISTYVFSNTNELAIRHIRRNFAFFSQFDDYIFSYEHGVMKPDPKLYEIVEQRSGRHEAEILYLDDRPENIAAGAARGWQVILQESAEKTRKVLQSRGLLNNLQS
jgi:epoxide hydrolase-like predicted phosphatase